MQTVKIFKISKYKNQGFTYKAKKGKSEFGQKSVQLQINFVRISGHQAIVTSINGSFKFLSSIVDN